MLRLYCAEISAIDTDAGQLFLSEYRLEKLEKIKSEKLRRQSMAVELLLNYAVEQICPGLKPPFDIASTAQAKPYFVNIPLHFSLSHSDNYILCALADFEIGADVEALREYNPKLAARFFAPEEVFRIENAADKDLEFTRIWTAKESALKCLGTGLQRSLSSVLCLSESKLKLYPEKTELFLRHIERGSAVISLCAKHRMPDVEILFVENL